MNLSVNTAGALRAGAGAGEAAEPLPAIPIRLEFLDGVRGLAALYVVLFHAWAEMAWSWDGVGYSIFKSGWTLWLAYGRFAVAVFIVLSGYCLMLPVVRRAGGSKAFEFKPYIIRRSRRILPPYYAALACSILIIACVPVLRHTVPEGPRRWDSALPALKAAPLLTHLLLIHNLSPAWLFKINNPMWSVATEWQIYFIFPLLLLPVWRRAGNAAVVLVGSALGLALYRLDRSLGEAAPWFIGLFAMGMAACAATFAAQPVSIRTRRRPYWGISAAALACLTVAARSGLLWHHNWGPGYDIALGGATACMLVYCALPVPGSTPLLTRLLESPIPVKLGSFSYSLYLTHFFVLGILHAGLIELHTRPMVSTAVMLSAGPALSLLFAYGFFLLFERPFLQRRVVAPRKAEAA
jgi:peptidoglycan/LPS O-acetylase OafA/YrhL